MIYRNNKRYNTLDNFYFEKFGTKVAKISLDGHFTCPNIDGTKGFGGCIYCSNGSGDYTNHSSSLTKQFYAIKEIMAKKWPNSKYIGYFQAHSNTYAPVAELKKKYEEILRIPNVIGLNIATRCDCISEECLDYLEELSHKTYLTIELGLQTIHEETSNLINRCHSLKEFEDCIKKLRARNINVVVHIINGLPYETKEMMLATIKYLNILDIQGVKIHMLHILKNTKLAELYQTKPFHILTKEEYVDIVVDELELLDPKIVINRLTGDPKVEDLVEPNWLIKKFTVLNDIDKELRRRNSYQGLRFNEKNRD